MRGRRESAVALVARTPVAVLGAAIMVSALHTSCNGPAGDTGNPMDAAGIAVDAGSDDEDSSEDSPVGDSPSEDSPADRKDGMSYGEGYGDGDARAVADAHEADAEHGERGDGGAEDDASSSDGGGDGSGDVGGDGSGDAGGDSSGESGGGEGGGDGIAGEGDSGSEALEGGT